MLGTISLPTTTLVVDSLAQVGGKSAYTAVARRLTLLDGPQLILNSSTRPPTCPCPRAYAAPGSRPS